MKRKLLAGVAIAVVAFAWYLGLVPLFDGSERAELRHALGVRILPSSVKILTASTDAWTDYIFRAEFSVSPADFEKLLRVRPYEKMSGGVDVWSCHYPPNGNSPENNGTKIILAADTARDRVSVVYGTD